MSKTPNILKEETGMGLRFLDLDICFLKVRSRGMQVRDGKILLFFYGADEKFAGQLNFLAKDLGCVPFYSSGF